MSHDHYFRSVAGLDRIDVYRLLDLFGVTCPVAQHVVKKALASGQRGHKTLRRDWQDIADSAARKLQMLDEDEIASAVRATAEAGGVFVQPADWPNEQRRQDAEDVTIWPPEERIDVIGANGNGGEHYAIGCATCHGSGMVPREFGSKCPACHGRSALGHRS